MSADNVSTFTTGTNTSAFQKGKEEPEEEIHLKIE